MKRDACLVLKYCHQRTRLGDVAVFENRQPVTAAKFINKSSLFILLPGFILRLELKPISEQKVENIFVAPPYCQTACCMQFYLYSIVTLRISIGLEFLISNILSGLLCLSFSIIINSKFSLVFFNLSIVASLCK